MRGIGRVADKTEIQAFKTLFSKCLGLGQNDDLLVIFDESLGIFSRALEQAIDSLSISSTLLFLPTMYQRYLIKSSKERGGSDKIDLPAGVIAAIAASTAIVNLLDATPDNAPVRKAVNHTPRPNNCRLATIPGISYDVLRAILEAPTDEIISASEETAWLLGEAKDAEIISFDSENESYHLLLHLGSWENEPLMSPGVLLPGSWGNVPPGETFCCPPHESVHGEICINGSVPGTVLRPGEEVILSFERGKLVSWKSLKAKKQSPAVEFFTKIKHQSVKNRDENWNTFAELGFGLNPKITKLTGNPLFDEKAAYTIHVAIGDNSVFGDDISSFIHEDMVTWHPSLKLDGKLVMERGRFNREMIVAQRDDSNRTLVDFPSNAAIIYLREGRIDHHNGVLMRRLSKAQRVNFVRMAEDNLSHALSELCDALRSYNKVHIATILKNFTSFSDIPTAQLLNILHHYRVLGTASAVPARRT